MNHSVRCAELSSRSGLIVTACDEGRVVDRQERIQIYDDGWERGPSTFPCRARRSMERTCVAGHSCREVG